MVYEISNDIPLPLSDKKEKLNFAQNLYNNGNINKSVAAKNAIKELGLGSFSTVETGVDYIRSRLIEENIQRQ